MDFYRRHPFWTGCLIGLVWGAFRYPAQLGCLVLVVLVALAVIAWLSIAWLLDAFPWLPLGAVIVGMVVAVTRIMARRRERERHAAGPPDA